jgi:hypothetical protein
MAARVATGGGRTATKPGAAEWRRPQSECGRHRWRRCSDRVADERGPRGFIFSQIIQTGSNLEIENGYLTLQQKFPIFVCS